MNLGLQDLINRSVISPLKRKGVRLLTKAALFVFAAFAFMSALIFLSAALMIWLVQLFGPLIATLIIAGVNITIGLIAVLYAIYGVREKAVTTKSAHPETSFAAVGATAAPNETFVQDEDRAAVINEAVIPIVEVLRSLGWKREELALLAGAELAKKLPPLTLMSLALICGFLIGRMAELPIVSNFKKAA